MSEAVTVSSVDVQRARLLVRLNQSLGATTPGYVIKIAEAQPEAGQPVNGVSHDHVNGVARELPPEADPA